MRARLIQTPTWRHVGAPPIVDTPLQLPYLLDRVVRDRPDVIYVRTDTLTVAMIVLARALGVPVVT